MWLTVADMHCAKNDACQRWNRVSPSRGKMSDNLVCSVLTIGQGGIVFDSDPYDEWMETINKLGALFHSDCLAMHDSASKD